MEILTVIISQAFNFITMCEGHKNGGP